MEARAIRRPWDSSLNKAKSKVIWNDPKPGRAHRGFVVGPGEEASIRDKGLDLTYDSVDLHRRQRMEQ